MDDAEREDLAGLLARRFRSTKVPVTDWTPYHLVPGVASIAREVVVPDMLGRPDPDHCCRLYVVNVRDHTQRLFLCEGFGDGDAVRHTRLPDLWNVCRANPAFVQNLIAVM